MKLVSVALILSTAAFAMMPVGDDAVLYDGPADAVSGAACVTLGLASAGPRAGLYLAVEGIEAFTVELNGAAIREVKPGRTPRTLIRTVDLSGFARLLKPGANRLVIRPHQGEERFRLRVWTSEQAWYLASLHAHTTYSDGALTVHELLREAAAQGGHAYAVTDHETLEQCDDTAFHAVGRLQPIRGYEWTTDSGHANLLGIEGSSILAHGPIPEMIDEASWRGALVQINHPCDFGTLGWARYPYLDPGVDLIEVFNSVTWFPGRTIQSDAQAVAWWHDLLAAGATIAAVGNSDFHQFAPGLDIYRSCSFVRAPSNDPDSILKYAKLGTVMVMDAPDDTRLWLYADTNSDGIWDIVMGEHFRVGSGTRTVRFRLEAEDADWGDVVYAFDRSGRFYSKTLWTGGDYAYEWSRDFGPADRDFMRVEIMGTLGADYEGVTNPIYVNHPDYELGPLRLVSREHAWPDTLYVGRNETLSFSLHNTAGYSPYQYALLVALDTALFSVTSWQTSGPGVGTASRRSASGHTIIEWRGGYRWNNRLSAGTRFDFQVTARPKAAGSHPVLFCAWADDRLFVIGQDPDSGFVGPEGRQWHRRFIPVEQLTGAADTPRRVSVTELRASSVGRGGIVADLTVGQFDRARTLSLGDAVGRIRQKLDVGGLSTGEHRLSFAPLPPGLYFLRLDAETGSVTRKAIVTR